MTMNKCKMGLDHDCSTCKFNFVTVCAGKHYGKEMPDDGVIESDCDGWRCHLNDFAAIRCDGRCNL